MFHNRRLPYACLVVVVVAVLFVSCVPAATSFMTPQQVSSPSRSLSSSSQQQQHQQIASTSRVQSRSTSESSTTTLCAYKKVFVAGGSKGVGRCIIDELIQQNIEVVALVRSSEVAEQLNQLPGVKAIVGDAFIIKDVENAMDGCDAAVTTLGGSTGDDPTGPRVDYEGNNNVIESAGILGVTRVVLVTSVGCGNSKEATPPNVYEVLKDVLIAKSKAETILMKYYTNTFWTIIRPGGLKSEKSTGKAILTDDPTAIGSIHREDVAKLVVKALQSDKATRQVLTAIDPTITSSVSVSGKEIAEFVLN